MQPDTLLPTRASAEFATRMAAELYGIEAAAQRLPGEYDDNFQLSSKDGTRYVLKIMHRSRERDLIELQCRVLSHIGARAPQLQLPRVQPLRSGNPIATVTDETGANRHVWMLNYIGGRSLVETRPHAPQLLESLGEFMGRMDAALADFADDAARRELKWDLSRAGWIGDYVHHIEDPTRRRIVETFMTAYDAEVVPALPRLRRSVIHGDANDHNVLTDARRAELPRVVGVIDFGDMHYGITVCELAVAAAYALLGESDPLAAAAHVAAGYHRVFPLTEPELAVLFPLIAARLCVSVVNSAHRKTLEPGDPYIVISEAPAWAALEKLAGVSPRFAHYTLRAACGLPCLPQGERIAAWLRAQTFAPLLANMQDAHVFDLSVASLLTGADPAALRADALSALLSGELRTAAACIGVGRYDEARALYTEAAFGASANPTDERRTVHLGIDLFATAGTAVHAPLAGTVHALADNAKAQDYGPVIVLRHETDDAQVFFTLYGHLSRDSLDGIAVRRSIARGQRLGAVGNGAENGGWPEHVHFQIIVDLLDLATDFPGVARASERKVWLSLSPDPNLILRIPAERFPTPLPSKDDTLRRRQVRLGGNLSISYRDPLKVVRGWKQRLYDETGRAYLDVYNNVPLVGHSHPRVVKAAQRQLALLNTNTRYLHDNVVRYAERLTALMPEPLRVCYVLNSASETNELALRLARTYTRRQDIIVLEHAYHGHTNTLIDISPYKFDGPGGSGRKPWVHVAPIADGYRGLYRYGDAHAGAKFAAHVAQLLSEGVLPAAFIAETLPSVGGQIVFPSDYLAQVYRAVRAAGGVCIADEVQVGFGRLGQHFWGFESQGVVPDIVVLGKPIGNGFPLAALVTTPAIAAAFDNGMEFFSTFGGNPVACAAGLAVLDVVRDEGLAQNAQRVGTYLRDRLSALMERHALVGDVRGMGLFLGVELVCDRESLKPAEEEARYVVNRLRDHGVLAGTDGPHHNVLKIRPPLCFCERDADLFITTLEGILAEDGLSIAARDPRRGSVSTVSGSAGGSAARASCSR